MKTPANTEHSGSNHGNGKPDVMLRGARLEDEADKNDIIANNDRKPAAKSSSTSTSSTDEKAAYREQFGVAIQCLDQRPVAQQACAPSVSSPEELKDTESTSKYFKERDAQAAVVSSLKNPGAQYIPRTAPGFIPSLVQQHQQETLAAFVVTPLEPLHISPEESPRESSIIKNQRTYYVWCAVILACILAVVAVALGVLLRAPGDKHEAIVITQVNPTSFSPIAMNCNFLSDDKQPNVFSQCACNGNVSVVAPDIMERYQNLTNTFVRSVFPQFNEGLHSCSPQNQALLWLASGDGVTTEARMRQRYTLALLFASWDGVNWLSRNKWLSSSDECSWFGLDCNGQGVVVNLDVAENNAIIDLAFMAPLLDHVEALNVSYNTLMDNKIPTEVGLLSKMKILDVTGTGVNGSLPTELFDLGSSLQSFSASYNFLSGTISTFIGNLVHLKYLSLQRQRDLTGAIPSQLGRCTDLVEIWLLKNKLNSTIPSEIGLLTALEQFSVFGNDVTGTLPTELGRCTNLLGLDLGSNRLIGTLPSQLASANLSQGVDVEGNHLTVPRLFCQKFAPDLTGCSGCNC